MPYTTWPGGIPSCIKTDEVPIPWKDTARVTKGWYLFVQENWVPRDPLDKNLDPLYEVTQRRSLMCKWALATQSFRDEYQSSAPDRKRGESSWKYVPLSDLPLLPYHLCIAPLSSATNRALWTKIRILSHDFQYGGTAEPICETGISDCFPPSSTQASSPASFSHSSLLSSFLPLTALHPADFTTLAMTVHGTVCYNGHRQMFTDQYTLETGMIQIVDFTSNGTVEASIRIGVLNFSYYFNLTSPAVLGKPVVELITMYGSNNDEEQEDEYSKHLNMSVPILEIFRTAVLENAIEIPIEDDPEKWKTWVETVAPGYLDMETLGKEGDYDHKLFMEW